jgi:alkanesulfonate monooxygenase SsuD/methylene tetrahydromethanopterin reductase-like flavin-dependent oxidoreductase (luciferase family)
VAFKIGVGLFAGQLPDVGGRSWGREYRDYLDLVGPVEASGLDAVWVSGHHFARDGYLPSLEVEAPPEHDTRR